MVNRVKYLISFCLKNLYFLTFHFGGQQPGNTSFGVLLWGCFSVASCTLLSLYRSDWLLAFTSRRIIPGKDFHIPVEEDAAFCHVQPFTCYEPVLGKHWGIQVFVLHLHLIWCVCVCGEISASDWSFGQRNPTECSVSELDREACIIRKPWPTRGCCAIERKYNLWSWRVATVRGRRK
jgi:hypothetical protein